MSSTLATNVISPLPSPETIYTSGPSNTSISFQLPFHTTIFLGLNSNATLLFPPFGQPSANDSLHVNSPMMSNMVVNLNDILNIELDFDLLPCPPPHKLKNLMIIPRSLKLSGLLNCLGLKVSLPLMVFFTMLDARFVAPLTKSHVYLLPHGIH